MNEHLGKNNSDENKYKIFGERLDTTMFRQDISNRELASRMFVSTSTISGYRTGRRSPKVDDLARLASLLNVSADYLIGRTDQP
jgi:transcriptional regulator with XRE-family HTH domain